MLWIGVLILSSCVGRNNAAVDCNLHTFETEGQEGKLSDFKFRLVQEPDDSTVSDQLSDQTIGYRLRRAKILDSNGTPIHGSIVHKTPAGRVVEVSPRILPDSKELGINISLKTAMGQLLGISDTVYPLPTGHLEAMLVTNSGSTPFIDHKLNKSIVSLRCPSK
jgi:hypothetical protein